MTFIHIIVEGQTEQQFCKEILAPHLANLGKYVYARPILTNRKKRIRGGMVEYPKFRNDVIQWNSQSPSAYYTMFVDYYGLKSSFPGFEAPYINSHDHASKIEQAIHSDLAIDKFIPYIQLHEFEALLFADPDILDALLRPYNNFKGKPFHAICEGHDTPEDINNGPETAPSKRILAHCEVYDKVDDGFLIAHSIGLETIRKKCPRFDSWLLTLERLP